VCSENRLVAVPASLARLDALRKLHLQSNKLKTFPYELVEVSSLEEIDLSGNPSLEAIPSEIQGNAALVLWICCVHRGVS
jgi:Leucine-rich repeat (LRR) protein